TLPSWFLRGLFGVALVLLGQRFAAGGAEFRGGGNGLAAVGAGFGGQVLEEDGRVHAKTDQPPVAVDFAKPGLNRAGSLLEGSVIGDVGKSVGVELPDIELRHRLGFEWAKF